MPNCRCSWMPAPALPIRGRSTRAPQLTGFAQRIAVNPALLANPAGLVTHAGHTAQGDPERPQFLLDALTKTKLTFSQAAGMSGNAPVSSSVVDFAQQVVETQGANAESASRLDEGAERRACRDREPLRRQERRQYRSGDGATRHPADVVRGQCPRHDRRARHDGHADADEGSGHDDFPFNPGSLAHSSADLFVSMRRDMADLQPARMQGQRP